MLLCWKLFPKKNNKKWHGSSLDLRIVFWLRGNTPVLYIKDAEIFPGFLEFAVQSKLRGSELFIVSHKTKYGYYNTKKFFLRKASLNWLKLKNILGTKKKIIDKNHIFFETKKKDKIRRIKRLDCTHFRFFKLFL